jgi:16S rRNA (adenine1518-N6/adenine1519-N6)-dimethyltransferase
LTSALAQRGHHVQAIERDRDLIPVLNQELREPISEGRVTILEADAKQVDYAQLFQAMPAPRALVGNLPYNLTGPLLRSACSLAPLLDSVVFLVQLEVAERLCSAANAPNYGALTVFAQAAFDVKRAFVVRRGAFYPQPNVDSAVVVMTPTPNPIAETEVFRVFVKAAFAQRRKTLRNSWGEAFAGFGVDAEEVAHKAGVNLGARGETLGVREFQRLTELVEQQRGLR